jgi:hypothetical protein
MTSLFYGSSGALCNFSCTSYILDNDLIVLDVEIVEKRLSHEVIMSIDIEVVEGEGFLFPRLDLLGNLDGF